MTKEEVLSKVKFHAELRGLSKHTQEEYYIKAKMFQNHFGKPATELDISHIQSYLHHLRTERKLADGSVNTYNSGLRFLYNIVLDKPLNLHQVPCIRKQHKFPEILTRDEILKLFNVCKNIRDTVKLHTYGFYYLRHIG